MSTLKELPNPPKDKHGWPWTDSPVPPKEFSTSHDFWPKISIVTPSFNQSKYLEETIRSVLLQGYPNLEYILIDGGSTDGSLAIIEKYAPWISYWQSEPDLGQSHALETGYKHISGEIMAWINSDDYYQPDAFRIVSETFNDYPEIEWVAGVVDMIDSNNQIIKQLGKSPKNLELFFVWNFLYQPGIFWRNSLWRKVRGIDVILKHSMDYDLWFQFLHFQDFPFWINKHLANFRKHSESKSSIGGSHVAQERQMIHNRNQDLLKTPRQRLKVKYHQRDFLANRMLNKYIKTNRGEPFTVLINSIRTAPWLCFQKNFYSKLKQILIKK